MLGTLLVSRGGGSGICSTGRTGRRGGGGACGGRGVRGGGGAGAGASAEDLVEGN